MSRFTTDAYKYEAARDCADAMQKLNSCAEAMELGAHKDHIEATLRWGLWFMGEVRSYVGEEIFNVEMQEVFDFYDSYFEDVLSDIPSSPQPETVTDCVTNHSNQFVPESATPAMLHKVEQVLGDEGVQEPLSPRTAGEEVLLARIDLAEAYIMNLNQRLQALENKIDDMATSRNRRESF